MENKTIATNTIKSNIFDFFIWVTPNIIKEIGDDDSEIGRSNSCLLALAEGYKEWAYQKGFQITDTPNFEDIWKEFKILNSEIRKQ